MDKGQKSIIKILSRTLIGLLALSMYACEDERPLEGDRVPAVFSPTLAGEVNVAASSRVVDDKWSAGDVVGIYMDEDGLGPVYSDFKQYKAGNFSGNNTNAELTPTTTDQTIYYPVDGRDVVFYAFSPYETLSSNEVTYGATDQDSQAELEAVDFIWAKAAKGTDGKTYNKKNPTVNLEFAHKQAKIIIQVTAGTGIGDMADAKLELNNMPYEATYDLSTGDLATTPAIQVGTVKPFKNPTGSEWQAIVPPHTNANYSDRSFALTLGTDTYTYTPTDNYEAGNSYTYSLILTKTGLVAKETTVTNWTGGTVAWNGGEYALHASASALIFPATASSQTLTIRYKTNDINTKPTVINSLGWVTADLADVSDDGGWKQQTLTVSTTADYAGESAQKGTITIEFQGLTVDISVTQGGLANCYIVAPGTTISFPDTRAKKDGTTIVDIVVLWDDNTVISGNPSYADGMITVTATNNLGNALIAAKSGDGDVLWSWHIWVTDYNPYQGATWTNPNATSFVFMDRNLGATAVGRSLAARGLLYQWGRKDPFPGGVAGMAGFAALSSFKGMPGSFETNTRSVTVGATNAEAIAEAIQNPTTFYIQRDENNYDWLSVTPSSNLNNTLWGNRTSKSVYDPCPAGWRVPSHTGDSNYSADTSPWKGMTSVNFKGGIDNPVGGFTYTGTGTVETSYPAAGYRDRSNASFNYGGSYGYYWSASPGTGVNAASLHFYNSSPSVNNNNSRANGLSVRCVQE